MRNYIQILLGALLLTLLSCEAESKTETKSEKRSDQKQLELADVTSSPFDEYSPDPIHIEVNSEKGGEFKFLGGSKLSVPKNAFIDIEGNPVKGKVDLYLKEFNSLSEILYHGVNMKYDSAGVTHDFVSAGMFHLSGEQNNKTIKVREDKSLTFSSVTDVKDSPSYNFYQMNEDNSWDYMTTKKAQANPDFEEVEKLKSPKETSPDDLVFELEFINNEEIYTDYNNILWKYAGYRQDTIDRDLLKSITARTSKINKTEENQLSYEIETTINNIKFCIPVEPVLSGENLDEAIREFQASMKAIKTNEEALQAMKEGKFMRTIKIPDFGMYNWDVIHNSGRKELIADIDISDGPSLELCTIFLVSKSDNSIVKYTSDDLSFFSYNPKVDNHLIVTIPGNKVAVLNSNDFFKQLDENNDGQKVVFQPKILAEKIEGSGDIQHIIETL